MKIYLEGLKDFLSFKFIVLSFVPLLVPMIALFFLLHLGAGEVWDILSSGASSGNFEIIDEGNHPYLVWILKFSFIKWIIITIVYALGTFFVVLLSVMISVIVVGFLTPIIVIDIHNKYYFENKKNEVSMVIVFKKMFFVFCKFILIFLVCLPLFFIPVVNIIAINFPFFYFFHNMLSIDVVSNIFDDKKFKLFLKKANFDLLGINFSFYLLTLIPVLGLFLQIYFVSVLTHRVYKSKAKYLEKI